jgi:uncharacterized membrane protein YfcA
MMLAAVLLGAVVGMTLALTGAGGGILAVPLLVFALHMDVAGAAPVGLLAVGLAAALGAALGLREGKVRYRAAVVIGGAGMLLAPLGVWLAQRLPDGPLAILFSLVLAGSARAMYKRSRAPDDALHASMAARPACVRHPDTGRFVWTRPCALALAATGMTSGLLSGLLGVGGGFVIVPALTRFSDLAAEAVVSTSLAVIAMVSVSAVGSAAVHGNVAWGIALPFAFGAIVAMLGGRQLARRVAGPTLQRWFSCLSAGVALMLLAHGVRGI